MMALKDRFPPGYPASVAPHYESEVSGSPGQFDSGEDSEAPMRKWIDLNSASRDGLAVPVQIIPLSKLSPFERKSLALRLTSELQQIRLLQNKVGLQKKNSVIVKSSSVDILSSNNGRQKFLQVKNGNKSSALDSGLRKKGRGWNRGSTGRFESANQKTGATSNAALFKQCESLLKKLMSQQHAWVFNTPVDVVKLNIPDYFDLIKNPMDLGTIKRKLTSGKYSSPLEFQADVRLTFDNAKTYNPPGTDVHLIADSMIKLFESRWRAIEKKLSVNISQSIPENSGNPEEAEIGKSLVPSKKMKLSPAVHEAIQKPSVQKMTDEEKHKLSTELEGLLGDLPENILEFLKAQTSNSGDPGEDEIEIDIDDLTDDTLFKLRNLLDNHLQEKEKNLAKSEACEIELPNVSGLSNSSMQVDKGNDSVEEDVDVGGNEAPVTSSLPGLIGKDERERAEECKEAAMVCEHSQPEQDSRPRQSLKDSDVQLDVESAQTERQVSPDKLYRAAILKNRFADTILKAQEKALSQGDKADPEKLQRDREELEMKIKREKARLQAEARAAEEAQRQAEAEAAAEAKRQRELEREAAREALHKMEKTVEINENSQFLEDLEMLRATPEQLPSSADEISPDHSQDGFRSFKFGGSNPLEQLGLYMKADEDEEEGEPASGPSGADDAEEGEIE